MDCEPLNILAVDDRPDDVELIRAALQRTSLPHRLFTASDGEDAISFLAGTEKFRDRARFPFPDVVLLDLKMPRLSGFDVLQAARWTPDLPHVMVYVFSSSALDSDIERAYSLGANAYFTKPESLAEMTRIFECLIRFHAVITPPLMSG